MSTTHASPHSQLSASTTSHNSTAHNRSGAAASDSGLWIAVTGPVIIALSVLAVSWLSRISF